MIGVGLDFGTSNSTIAWFDGTDVCCVQVSATGPVLPTALHLNRDYAGTTGEEAIEQYVNENAARLVQWVPEILGQTAGTIEDRSTDTDMVALETSRNLVFGPMMDPGLPGRLFLGLKRLLGNAAIDRLSVFGRPYRLVALLTPILVRLRESVEAQLQAPVGRIHVGRPVEFEGGDGERNPRAIRRLTEACRNAGFHDVEFYPEPVAATLSFLWQRRGRSNGTVLTVDFGGGTLDLCVVRHTGLEFRVLATSGAALGGDRIDQLMFKRFLFPLLGEGEMWTRQVDGRWIETLFPFNDYEDGLLNWAITHTLNQNKYKTKLTEMIARGGPAAVKFERLKDLINYNYSHAIFSAIKRAKAALSSVDAVNLDIPELNVTVPITREQFDRLLSDVTSQLASLIRQVLSRASLEPGDIDLVVRTGGSSQIVAVRRLLEETFPGKVTEHDPFTSVAAGLAIANYHGYHFS